MTVMPSCEIYNTQKMMNGSEGMNTQQYEFER